jgi:UMF1 family MFS transporter
MSDLKKSVIAAWASFDFAHTSYSIIMVTFVFPLYFANYIVTDGNGDLYWSIALSSSMLIVALLGPAFGAIADETRSKKKFLLAFTIVPILGTFFAAFLQPGMVFIGIVLFILSNAGFEGGTVFYDAFLPEIAPPQSMGKVSGYGFAAGYVGSLITIVATSSFLKSSNIPPAFIITAGIFAVFAIPLFLLVPEQKKRSPLPALSLMKAGFVRVIQTIKHIRNYRSLSIFLIAFFLYNDAILTVVAFSGLYAKNTLHFDNGDLIAMFAMVQTVAIVGSIIFGYVTDKFGPKRTIIITLCIWIGVVIGAYLTSSVTEFYIVAAVAGLALGSSQSASRSLMALLTPVEHTAEFFGFYDGFCGKASAVIGPLVFGVLSTNLGQRPAIVSLGLFFVVGLMMLRRVKV